MSDVPESSTAQDCHRPQARFGGLSIASALFGALTICCLAGCSEPRDLVRVSLEGTREPFNFICVVGENEGQPTSFQWYREKLGWGTMTPVGSKTTALEDFSTPGPHSLDDPVKWVDSDRYGILLRRPDRSWIVWWFDEEEVPLEGRSWICGGGNAHFDLRPPRTPASVSEESVVEWGVSIRYLDEYIEPWLEQEREWRRRKKEGR